MTSPPPIDWAMWEAIGTIFAASVALLFGLRDAISRFRNKPDIVLEHLPDENYVIPYRYESTDDDRAYGGYDEDWCQFNLKIRNKGSNAAKNVRVRIESIIQNNSNIINFQHFNRLFLSLPSLQHEESHIFHLIKVDFLIKSITLQRSGFSDIEIERKKFKITLLVTGDNFKAYRKTFEFIDSTDRDKIVLIEISTLHEPRYPAYYHTA